MTLVDAVATLVEYVREWDFEDRGYDYNVCPSCGWNNRMPGADGLSHNPGCKLREAIDMAEAFVLGSQATSEGQGEKDAG